MTIASYADLQTAVASWVSPGGAASVLTSILPDLILTAENRIAREIRAPEMETAYSGTIASGVIAVPTDFIGWKVVYVDSSEAHTLQVKDISFIYLQYPDRAATGTPKFIARNVSNFEFGPYPDSNYAIKGTYYKRPTAVATSWNTLATEYPDLYLFATLAEAAPFVRDEKMVGVWEGKYQNIRDFINRQAKEIDFNGPPLAMTPS